MLRTEECMKERPYGTLAPEMLRNSLGELAAHQTAPSTVLRHDLLGHVTAL